MKLYRNCLFRTAPIVLLFSASLCQGQQPQPPGDRDVSLKQIIPNILDDQKSIWSFPAHVAKGKDILATAAFAVIGTALVVGADSPTAHYFRHTTAFDSYNRAMPSAATNAAILATPLGRSTA